MLQTKRLTIAIAAALQGEQGVRSLFANSEQGVWYDPSDFERYMAERGPELVANGRFQEWNSNGLAPSMMGNSGVANTATEFLQQVPDGCRVYTTTALMGVNSTTS